MLCILLFVLMYVIYSDYSRTRRSHRPWGMQHRGGILPHYQQVLTLSCMTHKNEREEERGRKRERERERYAHSRNQKERGGDDLLPDESILFSILVQEILVSQGRRERRRHSLRWSLDHIIYLKSDRKSTRKQSVHFLLLLNFFVLPTVEVMEMCLKRDQNYLKTLSLGTDALSERL